MAKDIADYLGLENIVTTVSDAEAMTVIKNLSKIYDEPFADSSQIPTALISSIAKKHLTVALSGDAGDEVFGGYNRYKEDHTFGTKQKICHHYKTTIIKVFQYY